MLNIHNIFDEFQFGLDWTVYMAKPDKTYVKTTVRELLPMTFDPATLSSFYANNNNNNNEVKLPLQQLACHGEKGCIVETS